MRSAQCPHKRDRGSSPAMTPCYSCGPIYSVERTTCCAPMTAPAPAVKFWSINCWVHGVQHVFCVPGESYLAALDGLPRPAHQAHGLPPGGPARPWRPKPSARSPAAPASLSSPAAPGATNASPGIHIARQDSTPLIVFVGQVAREMREARGVPGARLSRGVRHRGEVGDRDRRSGANPRAGVARLLHGV